MATKVRFCSSSQESGVGDYLGLFANAAFGLKPIVERYKAAGDDYSYIMAEALADRCRSPLLMLLERQHAQGG